MSTRFSGSMIAPAPTQRAGGGGTQLVIGLIPLVVLLATVTATLCAVALTRELIPTSEFFTQQQVELIVVIGGLVLATGLYLIALIRALRRIATWQARGMRARVALSALLATALIVALPVVLAIVLPQSPAP